MNDRLNIYRSRPANLKHGNFGDELTSAILSDIFGIACKETLMDRACFIGVGSIIDAWSRTKFRRRLLAALQIRRHTLHVWGAGAMLEKSSFWWPQKLEIHAVRGHLTAARISNFSGAIGDPGILAPLLISSIERTDDVVLVPHFVDEEWASKQTWPKGWRVAHPDRPLKEVLTNIASAGIVVSSSLHGLITADAFGIPAVWAKTRRSLYKDSLYKFFDYASARGTAFNNPLQYEELTTSRLNPLATQPTRDLAGWRAELISAFPRDIRSQFSTSPAP